MVRLSGPVPPPSSPVPATAAFGLSGLGALRGQGPASRARRRLVPPGNARGTAPLGRGGGVWRQGSAGSREPGPRCRLYCLRGPAGGPDGPVNGGRWCLGVRCCPGPPGGPQHPPPGEGCPPAAPQPPRHCARAGPGRAGGTRRG